MSHSTILRLVYSIDDCRYHVPDHLQRHIDYITPGIKLTPVVKKLTKQKRASMLEHISPNDKAVAGLEDHGRLSSKAKLMSSDLQGCGYNMTPTCIKALYQIPDATTATPGNTLGLYEQGDYFAKSDLDLFYQQWAPWVPQGTYPIPALIDGANYSVPASSSLNTGESDIDIDLA